VLRSLRLLPPSRCSMKRSEVVLGAALKPSLQVWAAVNGGNPQHTERLRRTIDVAANCRTSRVLAWVTVKSMRVSCCVPQCL